MAASSVTRAEFVKSFDIAAGIAPVYPAVPDFADVRATSAYYGYIEAAYRLGYIEGVGTNRFDPGGLLTRAQIAKIEVTALGYASAAEQIGGKSTGFSDNASIPSWARGYVSEAVNLGLVKGYPDGAFRPNQTLTTSDESSFLSQYASVARSSAAPSSLSVSAGVIDAAVGEQVPLTVTVKSATGAVIPGADVTYQTSSSHAIVGNGTFIAEAPGNYTVTVATANGVSGSTVVAVYGSAVSLQMSLSGSLVADGQGTAAITVQAVDVNGNVDRSASGSVALFYTNVGGASSILNSQDGAYTPKSLSTAITDGTTAIMTDGVATFTLRAGTIPGGIDSLEAGEFNSSTQVAISSPSAATLSMTSSKAVATSISVVAPSTLATNSSSQSAKLSIQVLDQAGYAMVSGAYAIAVTLSGPATLAGGATQASYSYVGSGIPLQPATLSVPISSTGSLGPVTATLTSTGLVSKVVSIAALAVGSAVSIQVTPPANASFSEVSGQTGLTYGVQEVDANGTTVPTTSSLKITVEKDGAIAYNIRIDGYTQTATGVVDAHALSKGQFTITDAQTGADAGTYTIQISDPNGVLTAPPTLSFTQTAGQPTKMTLSSPVQVPVSNPTATVTATLQDSYGNPTETSGVVVTFSNASGNGTPGLTFSSSTATTVDGTASVTATAPVYVGNSYTVDASASGVSTPTATFKVVTSVASLMKVAFKDTTRGGNSPGTYVDSTTVAQASDYVSVTISAQDSYGNTTGAQNGIKVVFSSTGLVPQYSTSGSLSQSSGTTWTDKLGSDGTDTITCLAETAGTVTVTATDTSVSGVASGSQSMLIEPGNVWNYKVFTPAGVNVTDDGTPVNANAPILVNVTAEDEYGNTAVLTSTATIYLSDQGAGGTFTLPSGTSITSVSMIAGSSSVAVYYTNPSSKTVHLYATP